MVDEDILVDDPDVLLGYMRETKRAVFHNSNIFFRDLQYAVQDYFEDTEGRTISMPEAERIAKEVARSYERQGVFKRVNPQGYLLIYPDLLTPKEGGTIGVLNGSAALPPRAGSVEAIKAAQAVLARQAPAPKAAAAPKPAAKPAAASAAGQEKPAASPSATAPAGGIPAGAKAPPPWLKK